jgi:hypothetical protein
MDESACDPKRSLQDADHGGHVPTFCCGRHRAGRIDCTLFSVKASLSWRSQRDSTRKPSLSKCKERGRTVFELSAQVQRHHLFVMIVLILNAKDTCYLSSLIVAIIIGRNVDRRQVRSQRIRTCAAVLSRFNERLLQRQTRVRARGSAIRLIYVGLQADRERSRTQKRKILS